MKVDTGAHRLAQDAETCVNQRYRSHDMNDGGNNERFG
jgi:hypothetical protein